MKHQTHYSTQSSHQNTCWDCQAFAYQHNTNQTHEVHPSQGANARSTSPNHTPASHQHPHWQSHHLHQTAKVAMPQRTHWQMTLIHLKTFYKKMPIPIIIPTRTTRNDLSPNPVQEKPIPCTSNQYATKLGLLSPEHGMRWRAAEILACSRGGHSSTPSERKVQQRPCPAKHSKIAALTCCVGPAKLLKPGSRIPDKPQFGSTWYKKMNGPRPGHSSLGKSSTR